MLQSMGLQRVRQDSETEKQQQRMYTAVSESSLEHFLETIFSIA